MSRTSTLGVFIATAALALSMAPAASAAPAASTAPTAGAEAVAPVPTKPKPGTYDDFQSGVEGHRLQMEGAEKMFTMTANSLRDLAKQIEPLVGKQDSLSQESLKGYIDTANNHITTMKSVSTTSRSLFNKACTRFLAQHGNSWTTKDEKKKVKKNVEIMREVYNDFFTNDYQMLIDAATSLANQDVPNFWKQLALAEGGVAFNMHAFDKANKALRDMGS